VPTNFYITIGCVVVLFIQFYVNHYIFKDLESERIHQKQLVIDNLTGVKQLLERQNSLLQDEIKNRDQSINLLRLRLEEQIRYSLLLNEINHRDQ